MTTINLRDDLLSLLLNVEFCCISLSSCDLVPSRVLCPPARPLGQQTEMIPYFFSVFAGR
ncbi:hypothetical protein CR513_10197, partial [Mucuna pruriens]